MLKSIHKTVDAFGPIEVLDDGAKRYLTFGNEHEQSCQIKAQPHIPQHEYSRAIMLSLLFCTPQNVGVLGLGGGTMVCAFLNGCNDAMVTAVELRADVIRIAQRYFALPKHEPRLNIIHQDAKQYIDKDETQFDILVADLYHQHGIDDVQMQNSFLKQCAQKITSEGWLVLNYWLDHDLNIEILEQLHADFECIYMCNSGGGNVIIYAGKSLPKADFLLPVHIKPLAKKIGFSLNYYLKRLTLIQSV